MDAYVTLKVGSEKASLKVVGTGLEIANFARNHQLTGVGGSNVEGANWWGEFSVSVERSLYYLQEAISYEWEPEESWADEPTAAVYVHYNMNTGVYEFRPHWTLVRYFKGVVIMWQEGEPVIRMDAGEVDIPTELTS